MKIYFEYISYMLKRCKKNIKDYIVVQTAIVLLSTITSFIAIYLMKYSGGYLAGVIIAVLDYIPIIGNGLYLVYQIMYNLFTQNPVIASNLAVLYLTLLGVRLILEPVLLGRKLNLKIAIYIVIALIFRILGGPRGLAMSALIVFIINTLINLNDIYTFDRKRKMRARREQRLKDRERKLEINSIEEK